MRFATSAAHVVSDAMPSRYPGADVSAVAESAPEPIMPDSRREAGHLLEQAGLRCPPVAGLEQLARLRGVVEISESPALRTQGMTYPTERGLVIKVSAALPPVRRRFTLAHEIGHTYFFLPESSAGTTRLRHLSALTSLQEEGWCHNFAGDLLMPWVWLKTDMENVDDASIEALLSLAARYEVSVEALLLQLARFRAWPTLAIFCEPRSGGAVVRRVLTFGLVRRSGLARGTSVPRTSSIARAAKQRQLIVGEENWLRPVPARSGQGPVSRAYALESQQVSEGTVLTLVHIAPSDATRSRLAAAMRQESASFLFPAQF